MRLPESSSPHRVLVAEDDTFSRQLLVTRFQVAGCHVYQCPDGAAALEGLRGFKPDLMVLDLGLPKVDGYGVLKAMQEGWTPHHVPTLVLTGHHGTEDVVRARTLGADDYLVKPYSHEQMMLWVTRLLTGGKRQQQRRRKAA